MVACDTNQERPVPRPQLPFRVQKGKIRGYPIVELFYNGIHHTGVVQPYTLRVGNPNDPPSQCDPLGLAILRLMEIHYEDMRTVDDLVRQRDEAEAARIALEGELKTLRASMAGKERQARSAAARGGG